MQIFQVLLCLLALIGSSNLYATDYNPCKGSNLKKWAIKAGYPGDYCVNTEQYSNQAVEEFASTTLNPCRSDGSLKNWAMKAGYNPETCANPAPTDEIIEEETLADAVTPDTDTPTDFVDETTDQQPIADTTTPDTDTPTDSVDEATDQQPIADTTTPDTDTPTDSVDEVTDQQPITDTTTPETAPEEPVIVNTAPSVMITSPASGASIEEGQATQLAADISDAEDGNNLTAQWTSSLDGNITDIASLSSGEHIITALVTDSEGLSSSHFISITITTPAPPVVEMQSATLNWVAPTTRSNGEALLLSEIQGYEIYMIDEGNVHEAVFTIDSNNVTSHTVEELSPGVYHFAIATIDSSNLISELSESVSLTIQ